MRSLKRILGAVAISLLLSGCFIGIAGWDKEGGCVLCYKTGNDAVEMAKVMLEIEAKKAEVQAQVDNQTAANADALKELEELKKQNAAGPLFLAQQRRMNAALLDGRLDDQTAKEAVAWGTAGTIAAQNMAQAGSLAEQARQREALTAATDQLKAELDRLGV